MKRLLLLLTILFTCLSLLPGVAAAGRPGGGGSADTQHARSRSLANRAPVTPRAPFPVRDATSRSQPGPLAGLALGIGLATLLATGWLALRFVRSRKPQPAPVPHATASTSPPGIWLAADNSSASIIALAVASGRAPADFPLQSFLRESKATFVRLQGDNDRMDLENLREYTTPEMFAEISLQMHERGTTPQRTDVLVLHAELLELMTESEQSSASVRFTGQLRVNKDRHDRIDEVWHLRKELRDNRPAWLLAGIQQVTLH